MTTAIVVIELLGGGVLSTTGADVGTRVGRTAVSVGNAAGIVGLTAVVGITVGAIGWVGRGVGSATSNQFTASAS
ncbi:MAG TPA: hypothetical protein VJ020_10655, partial [Anaerolineales bacterium]|nr:hypothetical protein [Anaerolineales bacterium]